MKKITSTTAAAPFFLLALVSRTRIAEGFLSAAPSSVSPTSSSSSSSSSHPLHPSHPHRHPHPHHHPPRPLPPLRAASSSSPSSVVDDLPIDISENAQRNVMAFDLMWSSQNGILRSDGFRLVETDRTGRNVRATTSVDLPAGTQILYVPENLILSSTKAMDELRVLPHMEMAERRISEAGGGSEYRQYYLMLKVLLELQRGKDSPWHHWLNSLPRYYSNGPSMTEYCLLCLPPLMRKLVGEERENQRRLSDVSDVPFLNDDIKYHPRDPAMWAYQVVYTRSVEVYDESTDTYDLRIVPLADYFDHGSDVYSEVVSSYDAMGNYHAHAGYDVVAGTPLRIRYADPRNPSHLLARYGFLDETCPATYCKLLPPTVNRDMLDLGYSYDRMLFYRNGEVADEVWDIFLYSYLVSVDANEDVRALMNAHRSGDYSSKLALHERHYPATSAALLEHVDSFIEEIDALIAKAETIGVSDPNSVYIRNEHPRLPLIHRHNLFVRETFQNVRDRYDPSSSSDYDWREATRVTLVQECDESECAIAECMQTYDGEWECEGGLEPNPDGSERTKTQTVIA